MLQKLNRFATEAFPFWVVLATGLSLYRPAFFSWFHGGMIPAGLAVIMLGMGLTLSLEDFRGILQFPMRVAAGFVLQYTIMPLLGWSLSYVFNLPPPPGCGVDSCGLLSGRNCFKCRDLSGAR